VPTRRDCTGRLPQNTTRLPVLVTRGLIVRHSNNMYFLKLNSSKYWNEENDCYHFLPAPKQLSHLRRRMCVATRIPLLPIYAFMAWAGTTSLFLCIPSVAFFVNLKTMVRSSLLFVSSFVKFYQSVYKKGKMISS